MASISSPTTTLPNGTKLPYTYKGGLSLNTSTTSTSHTSSHTTTSLTSPSNPNHRHPSIAPVDLGLDSPKTGMPPSPQLDSGYVNPRTYPASFTARKGSVMDPRRTSLASKGGVTPMSEKGRLGSVSTLRSPVYTDKERDGYGDAGEGSSSSAGSSPSESFSAGGMGEMRDVKEPLGTVREVEPYFDDPLESEHAAATTITIAKSPRPQMVERSSTGNTNSSSDEKYTVTSPLTSTTTNANGGLAPPPAGWQGRPDIGRRRSSVMAMMGMGRRRSSVMDSIKSYIKPGAQEEGAEAV